MPVYDYRCNECNHEFIVIESLLEHEEHQGIEPQCPECDSKNVERRITSVNIQTAKKF